jgi:hypothetical protein
MPEPALETAPETPKPTYPKRPQFYSAKFIRKLTKSAAAMEIGAQACYMLTIIVLQEDSCRYMRPVTFWDEQLAVLSGIGCRSGLQRHREKAVKAGWLHYEPGRKGVPGKYWVTIPPHAEVFRDTPVDDELYLQTQNETESGSESRQQAGPQPGSKQVQKKAENGSHSYLTLTLTPNPVSLGGESVARAPDPGFDSSPPPDPADDVEVPSHPHFDWLTIEREFLEVWNNSPDVVPYKSLRNFQSRFRNLWLDEDWRLNCYRGIAKLSTTYWAGRAVALSQFLKPEFLEELLGGKYSDHGAGAGRQNGVGGSARAAGRAAPLHLRLGGDIEPRAGDPF